MSNNNPTALEAAAKAFADKQDALRRAEADAKQALEDAAKARDRRQASFAALLPAMRDAAKAIEQQLTALGYSINQPTFVQKEDRSQGFILNRGGKSIAMLTATLMRDGRLVLGGYSPERSFSLAEAEAHPSEFFKEHFERIATETLRREA